MKIVLASVLKSNEDTRLYHKIAQSLQTSLPTARVEVWGQGNLFRFRRLGMARVWANLTFFWALWRAKPTTVVVATFELLPAGVLYKWLRGGKLGYDVQENYVYNVLYTSVFPRFLRGVLAFFIRLIERCALPFLDFVWVAEECYLAEMPFLRKKATFLPNKILKNKNLPLFQKVEDVTVLYCGNVSRDYGVFEAVEWVAGCRQVLPTLHLCILGHCPRETDRTALEKLAKQHTFVELRLSDSPIAHATILDAMAKADWLVMPYQINRSVAGRIPTKFYEALALGKRMIITEHPAWQTFMAQFPEAVIVWKGRQDANELAQEIRTKQAVLPTRYEEGVFWEDEKVLIGVLQNNFEHLQD